MKAMMTNKVIAPPNKKVILPDNVEAETLSVTCDDLCEIGMEYVGSDLESHEFKCAAEPGQCPRIAVCQQYRCISVDSGYFQPIPHATNGVSKAIDLRKNGERPCNLLKNVKVSTACSIVMSFLLMNLMKWLKVIFYTLFFWLSGKKEPINKVCSRPEIRFLRVIMGWIGQSMANSNGRMINSRKLSQLFQ